MEIDCLHFTELLLNLELTGDAADVPITQNLSSREPFTCGGKGAMSQAGERPPVYGMRHQALP